MYPQHDNLPDPEIRAFITNFYRISDKFDSNELWVSYFDKDAFVKIGNDSGKGEQGQCDSVGPACLIILYADAIIQQKSEKCEGGCGMW